MKFSTILVALSSSSASAANLDDSGGDRKRYGNGDASGRRLGELAYASHGASTADCSKSVSLKLPGDWGFSIDFRPDTKSCDSGRAYVGSSDDGHKHLTLVPSWARGGAFSASITDDEAGAVFSIGTDANGTMAVTVRYQKDYGEELDPVDEMEPKARALLESRSPPIPNFTEDAVPPSVLRGKVANQLKELDNRFLEGNPDRQRTLQVEPDAYVDVLVLWTSKAECNRAGLGSGCTLNDITEAGMRELVDLAVQETNTAYKHSGVAMELNLAHAEHTDYTETRWNAFNNALSDMKNGNGGLSNVPALREQYKADVVALIIHDTMYCGIAYLGPRVDLMYSITAWNCATGYYSFGHEIAHNFGCNHDRGSSDECSNGGYNFGWRDPQANFRSILAYDCKRGQCDDNQGGGECTRVQRFSNPNYLYNGKAMGSDKHDNARQINNVRFEVADYYVGSRSPTTSPTPCRGKILRVDFVADDFASETSWQIVRNCDGSEVIADGPAYSNNEVRSDEYCVEDGELTFTIFDSYGDGICCSWGEGSYAIYYDGKEVFKGGEFEFEESKTFGSCERSPGIMPLTKSPTATPSQSPTAQATCANIKEKKECRKPLCKWDKKKFCKDA
ncbi:hypothetical protein ACHAWF_016769 [Thalassiosira exigua]